MTVYQIRRGDKVYPIHASSPEEAWALSEQIPGVSSAAAPSAPEEPSILGRFASRTGFAGLSQVPGAIADIAGQGVMGGAKALAGGLAGTLGQYAGEFAPSAIASQYKHLRTQGDTPEGQAQGLVNMSPVGAAAGSIPLFGKMAETISSDVVQGKIPESAGDIFSAAPMLLGLPGFRESPVANAPLGRAAKVAGKGALKVATNPVVVGAGTLAATGSPMTAIEATAGAIALRAAKDPTAFDSMAAMPGMVGRVGRAMKELSGKPVEEQTKIIRGLPENEWKLMQDHLVALKVNDAMNRAAQARIDQASALKEKYRGLSSPQELKIELDRIKAQEIDAKARGLSPDEFRMQRDYLEAIADDIKNRGVGAQEAAVSQAQMAAGKVNEASRGLSPAELAMTKEQIAAGAEDIATRGLGRTELPKTQAQIAAEAQNTATRNLGPNQYPVEQARIAAGAEDAATRGLGSTEFPKTQAQITAGEADITNRGVSPLQVRMEQARIAAQKTNEATRNVGPTEFSKLQAQAAADVAMRRQRGVSPNEFETSQAQIAAKAEEAKRLKAAEAAAPVEDGVLKAVEGEKPAPKDGVLKAVENPKAKETPNNTLINLPETPGRIRKATKAMAKMIEYVPDLNENTGGFKLKYTAKEIVDGIRKSNKHDGVSEATLLRIVQELPDRMMRARRLSKALVRDGDSLRKTAASLDADHTMPSEFSVQLVRDAARELGDKLTPAQAAELASIEKITNKRKGSYAWYKDLLSKEFQYED